MNEIYYCNDPLNKGCRWSGDQLELVSKTDNLDDTDYNHCPQCLGNDFQIEEEEEEQ